MPFPAATAALSNHRHMCSIASAASMSSEASPTSSTNKLEIFVIQMNGNTLRLEVLASANVFHLKLQIAVHESIPHFKQELLFEDNRLDNCRTLTEIGIYDGAMLQLLVCDGDLKAEQCIVCGRYNRFHEVSPACESCSIMQSREYHYFDMD
jgi:hypothetical protein